MSGRKKYEGEVYSFFRSKKTIGKGGNGAVYNIEFEGDKRLDFPVVAKFFEYTGVDKEKRYNRFRNEIVALNELQDIELDLEVKYKIFYELDNYFNPIYAKIKNIIHKEKVDKLREENRRKRGIS